MSIKDFDRPSLTTDMVLFRVLENENPNNRKTSDKSLQVLLIKRDSEPQKGFWSLPGGFVNIDEEIVVNVKRKLREKTGVYGDFYIEQLYTWGDLGRDERGRVVSVSFLGLCHSENYTTEEVETEVKWENVKNILLGEVKLAFDHLRIIKYALERIQNKVEYTDIAFNLLPDTFTISDCKAVYELILDRPIDNFNRKVKDDIEATGELRQGKQFRPAALYKVKNKASRF